MILHRAHDMNTNHSIELNPASEQYLAFEAAECGVSESEVVGFALSLLAHYRRAAARGAASFLTPESVEGDPLRIHLTVIPSDVRLHSPVAVEQFEAYLMRLGGQDEPPGPPRLRIVS